jgi:ABC-type glycerol-3-phosphate transport system substrate-binding protein
MGRYIEKNIPLPESITAGSSMFLTKRNNLPFLLEANEKPSTLLKGYQLNKDGSWTEDTPAWLTKLSLPNGWSYKPSFMEDNKGNQYLYYLELNEYNLIGHLLRSTDGVNYEELIPEGWNEENEDGYYNSPYKAAILEDGSIAAMFYNGDVILYDNVNYKEQTRITGERFYEDILLPFGKSLLVAKCDDSQKLTSVEKYDLKNTDHSTSFPYTAVQTGYSFIDWNEKGDLFLANPDGIHKVEKDTSVWNMVVDGTLTSLSMPTMYLASFIATADEQFYAFYNTDSASCLMQYSFDETIATEPSDRLTIYSLKDNNTIRQAIAKLQQQNPDVKVDFTTAMTEEEYAQADETILEDYIRSLNTKLLANDGYDILVLDGLPTASFCEKGILEDMSSLIQPMLDSGELMPNILSNYKSDGKIYYIPVRYALNVLFCKTADTGKLTTLDSLAEYAKVNAGTTLFDICTEDGLIEAFAPYLSERFLKPDNTIDREALINTLEGLNSISKNSEIVDAREDARNNVPTIWGLTENASVYFGPQKGFLESMFDFGMIKRIDGYFTSFENSFTPICELGINTVSSNKELAKEFISLVLSEEIQKEDLYDGFPVNAKALEICANADRSNYSLGFSNGDNPEPIHIYAQTQDQIKDIVSICNTADRRLVGDEHITAALKEGSREFFAGNQTSAEAADAIIEKLKIYLME